MAISLLPADIAPPLIEPVGYQAINECPLFALAQHFSVPRRRDVPVVHDLMIVENSISWQHCQKLAHVRISRPCLLIHARELFKCLCWLLPLLWFIGVNLIANHQQQMRPARLSLMPVSQQPGTKR